MDNLLRLIRSLFMGRVVGNRNRKRTVDERGRANSLGCATPLVAAILICMIPVLIFPLFRNNDNDNEAFEPEPTREVIRAPQQENDPVEDEPVIRAQTVGVDLGELIVTNQVDRDSCPLTSERTLDNVDSFYVVARDSEVPEGTEIFARLFYDGLPLEDSPARIADRDYQNTCVFFIFEDYTNDGFDRGDYEVAFFVNGNEHSSVVFDVR